MTWVLFGEVDTLSDAFKIGMVCNYDDTLPSQALLTCLLRGKPPDPRSRLGSSIWKGKVVACPCFRRRYELRIRKDCKRHVSTWLETISQEKAGALAIRTLLNVQHRLVEHVLLEHRVIDKTGHQPTRRVWRLADTRIRKSKLTRSI